MLTNDELKKKILEILKGKYIPVSHNDGDFEENYFLIDVDFVDALIAAGIGDVKDLQAQVNVLEITNIALQAGYDDAENDRLYWVNKYKEAEHHAEVAERAFSKLVHEMYEHGIRPMCDEKIFTESRLKEAEKELAEERKDA